MKNIFRLRILIHSVFECLWIERNVYSNLISLLSEVEFLKYVFNLLKLEKLISTVATDAGRTARLLFVLREQKNIYIGKEGLVTFFVST